MDCIGRIRGAYLVIIKNRVSSGLNDMIIPPAQSKFCMKVPRTMLASTTIFRVENIYHNFVRLACKRKQMGNVEQNGQVVGMVSLAPVLSHVKLISTLTEAKIVAVISAWITGFGTEDQRWVQEDCHKVLRNCCIMLPCKFKSMVLGIFGE